MCYSRQVIKELLSAESPSPELAEMRQHAKECETCAAEIAAVAEELLIEQVAMEGGHIDPLTLSYYLDEELPVPTRLLVQLHLERCRSCGNRLASMKMAQQAAANEPLTRVFHEPAPARPKTASRPMLDRRLLTGLGVLAAVAVCFGLIHLESGPGAHSYPGNNPGQPVKIAELANGSLRYFGSSLILKGDNLQVVRSPLGDLDASSRRELEAAVNTSDRSSSVVVRGESSETGIVLICPQPRDKIEPGASIEWNPLPAMKDRQYHVRVREILPDAATGSSIDLPVAGAKASLSQLHPGREYEVKVSGDDVSSAWYTFTVLSSTAIEAQRRANPEDHLSLGLACKQAGYRGEAIQQFRLFQSQIPDSKLARWVARRLVRSIAPELDPSTG